MIAALLQPPGLVWLLLPLLASAWFCWQWRQSHGQLQALARTNAALAKDKCRAEEASQRKSHFLGQIGHEIRTPLNALIGLLELVLQRSEAHSRNYASLQLALGAARDLRELLGDLLDISRIESAQLQLNPAWADLRDSVDAVMGVFQVLARQKHLQLSLEFEAPSPEPQVLIDALRFKQVLGNLLSNAIKFTHEGEVQVRLQLRPTARTGYFDLQLQVLDSGIGIPEEERQRLLLPFAQIDPSRQSPRDSTGLGLPISHQLCLQMGGSLSLHGREGPGSEVRVQLTLAGRAAPAPSPGETLAASTGAPLDILLADDHHASLTLLQDQLEYLGHRVTCAEDGMQAYQLWLEGDFDLLILDCNMPSMDGYQLARAIRRSERQQRRPAVTLLGCSASDDPQTRQRGLQAGMQDCLCKPLGLELLGRRLAAVTPLPRVDSFSMHTLRTLTRGEPLFARRMLDELLRCAGADRRQLGLIAADDPRALEALAHKIKGSALMVGAEPLQAACEALEQACLDPANTPTDSAIRALDLALVRFAQSLHHHLDAAAQAPGAPVQGRTPNVPDLQDRP
ncbi:response regulator [Pseudomonas sp. NFXW11]|uniref:ATP-binding response regulator n=1 Tax=Pseudomonas sp. NFXW11 TaxID=2819531 RepID=UPI003CF9DCDE